MFKATKRKLQLALGAGLLTIFGAQAAAPATPVLVDSVFKAPNAVSRRYAGRITAINHINSTSRVSGDLIEQGFKQGEMVKKGQLLFAIDDTRYQAMVKAAQAKIGQIKAQLEYAESDYARKEDLFKKEAVSLDALESVRAQLKTLKAQLLAAEADLILAQDDLKNCRIVSPIDGKTGKAAYALGNYITPSSGTLVSVTQLDPIRVRFSISQRDYLALFGNEKNLISQAVVTLKLADGITYKQTGRIEIVDNQTVNSTDAIRVWARFDNPELRLIPNAAITVNLSKNEAEQLPAVLPSAVMHDRKGAYTYVVNADNTVERREVVTGETDGEVQIILEGLRPGEKVIVEGMHKVRPGMPVDPVEFQKAENK